MPNLLLSEQQEEQQTQGSQLLFGQPLPEKKRRAEDIDAVRKKPLVESINSILRLSDSPEFRNEEDVESSIVEKNVTDLVEINKEDPSLVQGFDILSATKAGIQDYYDHLVDEISAKGPLIADSIKFAIRESQKQNLQKQREKTETLSNIRLPEDFEEFEVEVPASEVSSFNDSLLDREHERQMLSRLYQTGEEINKESSFFGSTLDFAEFIIPFATQASENKEVSGIVDLAKRVKGSEEGVSFDDAGQFLSRVYNQKTLSALMSSMDNEQKAEFVDRSIELIKSQSTVLQNTNTFIQEETLTTLRNAIEFGGADVSDAAISDTLNSIGVIGTVAAAFKGVKAIKAAKAASKRLREAARGNARLTEEIDNLDAAIKSAELDEAAKQQRAKEVGIKIKEPDLEDVDTPILKMNAVGSLRTMYDAALSTDAGAKSIRKFMNHAVDEVSGLRDLGLTQQEMIRRTVSKFGEDLTKEVDPSLVSAISNNLEANHGIKAVGKEDAVFESSEALRNFNRVVYENVGKKEITEQVRRNLRSVTDREIVPAKKVDFTLDKATGEYEATITLKGPRGSWKSLDAIKDIVRRLGDEAEAVVTHSNGRVARVVEDIRKEPEDALTEGQGYAIRYKDRGIISPDVGLKDMKVDNRLGKYILSQVKEQFEKESRQRLSLLTEINTRFGNQAKKALDSFKKLNNKQQKDFLKLREMSRNMGKDFSRQDAMEALGKDFSDKVWKEYTENQRLSNSMYIHNNRRKFLQRQANLLRELRKGEGLPKTLEGRPVHLLNNPKKTNTQANITSGGKVNQSVWADEVTIVGEGRIRRVSADKAIEMANEGKLHIYRLEEPALVNSKANEYIQFFASKRDDLTKGLSNRQLRYVPGYAPSKFDLSKHRVAVKTPKVVDGKRTAEETIIATSDVPFTKESLKRVAEQYNKETGRNITTKDLDVFEHDVTKSSQHISKISETFLEDQQIDVLFDRMGDAIPPNNAVDAFQQQVLQWTHILEEDVVHAVGNQWVKAFGKRFFGINTVSEIPFKKSELDEFLGIQRSKERRAGRDLRISKTQIDAAKKAWAAYHHLRKQKSLLVRDTMSNIAETSLNIIDNKLKALGNETLARNLETVYKGVRSALKYDPLVSLQRTATNMWVTSRLLFQTITNPLPAFIHLSTSPIRGIHAMSGMMSVSRYRRARRLGDNEFVKEHRAEVADLFGVAEDQVDELIDIVNKSGVLEPSKSFDELYNFLGKEAEDFDTMFAHRNMVNRGRKKGNGLFKGAASLVTKPIFLAARGAGKLAEASTRIQSKAIDFNRLYAAIYSAKNIIDDKGYSFLKSTKGLSQLSDDAANIAIATGKANRLPWQGVSDITDLMLQFGGFVTLLWRNTVLRPLKGAGKDIFEKAQELPLKLGRANTVRPNKKLKRLVGEDKPWRKLTSVGLLFGMNGFIGGDLTQSLFESTPVNDVVGGASPEARKFLEGGLLNFLLYSAGADTAFTERLTPAAGLEFAMQVADTVTELKVDAPAQTAFGEVIDSIVGASHAIETDIPLNEKFKAVADAGVSLVPGIKDLLEAYESAVQGHLVSRNPISGQLDLEDIDVNFIEAALMAASFSVDGQQLLYKSMDGKDKRIEIKRIREQVKKHVADLRRDYEAGDLPYGDFIRQSVTIGQAYGDMVKSNPEVRDDIVNQAIRSATGGRVSAAEIVVNNQRLEAVKEQIANLKRYMQTVNEDGRAVLKIRLRELEQLIDDEED